MTATSVDLLTQAALRPGYSPPRIDKKWLGQHSRVLTPPGDLCLSSVDPIWPLEGARMALIVATNTLVQHRHRRVSSLKVNHSE